MRATLSKDKLAVQPFTTLYAIAAPLRMADIDTDKIIAGRFLKTVARSGLGVHLFSALRYDANGVERPDFVLNLPAYRGAAILISFENFGCGSSREHAVWALLDFGIRCVIGPSFGDIFAINAVKNGLLLISLDRSACETLMASSRLRVDLPEQVVGPDGGPLFRFDVTANNRRTLLAGLDDITDTLGHLTAIELFESRRPEYLDQRRDGASD